MKRYEVLIDSTPVGWVEAMDERAALDQVYATRPDPRKPLSLRRDELSMHILIDTTNWRALARHDSYKALAALAVIQFANIDTQVLRLGENRPWSAFNADQLAAILASMGITVDADASFRDRIRAARDSAEGIEWLALPFTTEALEAQAYQLGPNEARPMGFDPNGSEPKLLKTWPSEPQRNRKRSDSSLWHAFAAGLGHGPGTITPETMSHLSGKAPPPPPPSRAAPSAPAKGKAAPKPPKPPKAPGAPATRPKAGTATGKVWDIADAAYKAAGEVEDWKAFKAAVTKLAEAEGINAGTVGVQFSKWKSSKGI